MMLKCPVCEGVWSTSAGGLHWHIRRAHFTPPDVAYEAVAIAILEAEGDKKARGEWWEKRKRSFQNQTPFGLS